MRFCHINVSKLFLYTVIQKDYQDVSEEIYPWIYPCFSPELHYTKNKMKHLQI